MKDRIASRTDLANPQSAIHNPQSMKILLLTWDFPPARGGIQTWMLELARRLPDARVHVLAPAQRGDREFDRASGVHVSRLASARLGLWAWLATLCVRTFWYCLVDRPDLIVCGHVVAAPAALLPRWLLRVPYVVFTHGYELRRKRRRRFLAAMLRNTSISIANSEFTQSTVEALGVPSSRVRVVYPGVDAARFAPATNGAFSTSPLSPPSPRTWRGGLGVRTLSDLTPFPPLPLAALGAGSSGEGARDASSRSRGQGESHPGGPTLLSVARLAELYKGHDTLIRVLPLVRARCPGTRLRVAGDGPLREYLHRIAKSVGVDDAVEFLGEVADDSLPELYRTSDAFVLMSRESPSKGGAEGFGIVCLEAAACETPVVAGRSGGLVDAVEDGVTGILVDPEEPAAVAEALIAVLSDSALAERMGQAGRARVLARFTWDKVIGDARRVFEEATVLRSGSE
jgi:phosphatidylinositol alpha-1,6-mannosyltransferase